MDLTKPRTVAVANSPEAFALALSLKPQEVDLVEIRLDAPGLVLTADRVSRLAACRLPLLFTARHPREGALGELPSAERFGRLRHALPLATLIDIELRSLRGAGRLIEAAFESGVGLVVSSHDFHGTPPASTLLKRATEAQRAGATIVKLATTIRQPTDLQRLLAFAIEWNHRLPWAVMGMGRLGVVSRLMMASLGSCLNYGSLGKLKIEGQLDAHILKQRIAEVTGYED